MAKGLEPDITLGPWTAIYRNVRGIIERARARRTSTPVREVARAA
jgi:hypothetical protein